MEAFSNPISIENEGGVLEGFFPSTAALLFYHSFFLSASSSEPWMDAI